MQLLHFFQPTAWRRDLVPIAFLESATFLMALVLPSSLTTSLPVAKAFSVLISSACTHTRANVVRYRFTE